jgi:O-antigen/teichoic acid export membrane protein
LFNYGLHDGAALLDTPTRLYGLLIGKCHGVRDLAVYSRAESTRQIPADLLSNTAARAALPILSKAAQDKSRLALGTRTALDGVNLLNAPIMLGLLATANNAVLTLLAHSGSIVPLPPHPLHRRVAVPIP